MRLRPDHLLRLAASRLFICLLASALLSASTFTGTAAAMTYGGGTYGQCAYSTDCPTPSTGGGGQTGGTIDVTININNNQTIPESGYEIVIVPKSNDSVPLQQGEVFANGQSLDKQPARPDGTIHLFVQPPATASNTIELEVVVTGKDGSTFTQRFTVRLSVAILPGTDNGAAQTSSTLAREVLHAVHQLPNAIKYALPFLLFVILALDIVILVLIRRREIEEQNHVRQLIERERQISSLKQTFIALVSHYLRTPLSVLAGGVDLLNSLGKTPGPAVPALHQSVADLRARVERLVQQAAEVSCAVAGQTTVPKDLPPTSTRPMLLIPVLLIGIIAFAFDYLAVRAEDFSLPGIDVVIQVVVFGSLAIVLYVAVRMYQVQKRELRIARAVLADEQRFTAERDEFIASASHELEVSLGPLDESLAAAGPTPASKFLKQGQEQIHAVADKLAVAQRIEGSEAVNKRTATTLSALYAAAMRSLVAKAAAKKVNVIVNNDKTLPDINAELNGYMLQTLIDNAIDYSPEGGTVTVAADLGSNSLTLSVADQGPGIDPKKTFALFEAFSRVEGAETFNREGIGLSLYLDRLIATYLHGTIQLENTAPHGALATIKLPKNA